MSTEKLKLEVLLSAIDKVTRPLKAIAGGSNETAKALKAAKDRLKELNDAQGRIDGFRKTSKDAAITANQLKAAQQRVKQLKDAMSETLVPSKAMTRALADARQEVSLYGMRLTTLVQKKERLRGELVAAAVPLNNLKRHQAELAEKINTATAAVTKQTAAMKAQNEVARRMHAARAVYDKSMARAGMVRNAGLATTAAGVTMGLPVVKAVKDYAAFETAMLGVARQVEGARDDNGRLTATYYEMGDAIKAMSERIPMTTVEIAKLVEEGARMGIKGKADLIVYAETAAVMAHAFDLPVEKIGSDMAKVANLYNIPIKNIRELGDTINYLDDNAQSSGGDIIEVMQRIAGVTQSVNMSFKDSAALASTFLSLGAMPEVAATASSAMIRELSIATMQTKRFKGGLEMLKLDAKALQFGMTKDATGTIIKVLEAIKALPQERQLEAATRLFGKEYGDDAAKLALKLDEYRKQLKLVNEERAKGSMQREADARKETIDSRLEMAKSAFFNLSSDLGETLKPALVETLENILAIIQSVREWARENPGLAGGIMTLVKWLAIGTTVIGGLLIAASAVLAPIALLRFGLAGVGISAGGAAAKVWALVSPVAKLAAAFYIGWKIGGWVADRINEIVSKVMGYETTLGSAIFDIIDMFKNAAWDSIGEFIVRGIELGLDSRTFGLYSKVKALTTGMIGAANKPLEIHSPSRAFMEIGGMTMAGLMNGIEAAANLPIDAVTRTARRVAAAGAGMLIGGSALAIDTRPALSPSSMAAGGGGASYIFHIYPSPGMDEQALARLVAQKIAEADNARAARGRSRLRDTD